MQNQLNIVKGVNKNELDTLETAPGEGVFALDYKNRLLYINGTAEKILGWSLADLTNKNFVQITQFKMNSIASLGTSRCAALHSVSCSHLQLGASITKRSGDVIPISYMSIPVFEDGRMYGKLFVFSEATYCAVSKEDYGAIVEHSGSYMLRLGLDAQVEYANEATRSAFCDKIEQIIPSAIKFAILDKLQSMGRVQHITNRVKTKDGLIRTVAWVVAPIRDSQKNIVGISCVGNDITEQDNQTKSLQPENVLARKILDNISDAVITMDTKGVVEYLNPMAEHLTGWQMADAKGLLLSDVFHVLDKNNRKPLDNFIQRRARDIDLDSEIPASVLVTRDATEFDIEQTVTAIRDPQGVIIGGTVIFRKESVQSASARSGQPEDYDLLTRLISRNDFETQLNKAIAQSKKDRSQHALCYVDVVNMRRINEIHGREVGDQILKQTVLALSDHIRESDVLARLGGDEFGVLLRKCSLDDAYETVKTVCQHISQLSFQHDHEKVDIGVNIGLVPVSSASGDVAELMRVADTACYVARQNGKNRVQVYRPHDVMRQGTARADLQWLHKIRSALDDNKFRLYCQSIVPIQQSAGHIAHHEILLRMLGDNDSVLRPAAFMPAAENFNLMPSIDRWVVTNTLKLLQERTKHSDYDGMFSINLSAQSLEDDNFLGYVIDLLDKTKVPADRICFEITESTAISNIISATRFMSILRGMGCRFSLDDFGRGFSSFGYLKNLPVDFLKIDGEFVRDLANDDIDHAMVNSINQIGHTMGVQTIAEFVETEETLEQLIHLGVDHVQGYQLGKPHPMWPDTQNHRKPKKPKKVQVVN
ncbi:MAG: EAL domain-containing protein [Gammaproteobacteria bacterium]|nr:EAL domain-containing protein [Gammaproteobacteria bacterium]